MSSEEFQIMRINQRTKEINQRQNTSKVLQSKISYQKLIPQNNQSQPVSSFVSRRELIQSSPVYAGGKNQLPIRANVGVTGNVQSKKVYKYEPRKEKTQVSSIGKVKAQENRKYQLREGKKKYETSGSPLNRRNNPMTFSSNNGNNFNIKKWAYASRLNQKCAKIPTIKSKTSTAPNEYMKNYIKQGENITEKIYPGKNNNLILERRKVEVFKNMNKNAKSSLNIKKAGENITEKIYQNKDNNLIKERRKVEVFKVTKSQTPSNIKMVPTESDEYSLRIQKSKNYLNKKNEADKETIINERRKTAIKRDVELNNKKELRKEAEKITEKIFKGQDNNLYLERRKVEVFRDLNFKKGQRKQEQFATIKKFKEENGITKSFIKEKMIEIWLDESSKVKENSFSLFSEEIQNRFNTFETRDSFPNSRNVSSEKNKSEINNLLKQIKEKDNELNKIANQLKEEITKTKKSSSISRNQIATSSTRDNATNYNLELKIQQLLSKIKEKDEQLNQLTSKIKIQSNEYEKKRTS